MPANLQVPERSCEGKVLYLRAMERSLRHIASAQDRCAIFRLSYSRYCFLKRVRRAGAGLRLFQFQKFLGIIREIGRNIFWHVAIPRRVYAGALFRESGRSTFPLAAAFR